MGVIKQIVIEREYDPSGFDAFLAAPMLTRRGGDLVATMRAEGIADPLAEPLTLAALHGDLFRLTGAESPRTVHRRIE